MKKNRIFALLGATFIPWVICLAQEVIPSVSPSVSYLSADNEWVEASSIDDGEAPLEVTFRANPQNMEGHTPSYEWHFQKQGEEDEFMVRYEENTTYRFLESGTFNVTLKTTLTDNNIELDSVSITVAISESKLEFPNAFSPNGDGINEIYQAKEFRSIVEFHAYIFNRWGQKLFDWTDPSQGWNGKFHGTDVKDGVYYVLVKAKGADGHVYNIRKDVNLLRGFTESNSSSTPSE